MCRIYPIGHARELITGWVLVHILEFVALDVQSLAHLQQVSTEWSGAVKKMRSIYSIEEENRTQYVGVVCSIFSGLTELNVTNSRKTIIHELTKLLPGLVDSRKLRMIRLTRCPYLDDEGLRSLTTLTQLRSLDLSYCNKITDLIALETLVNIQALYLNNCRKLSRASLLHYIPYLTSLRHLELIDVPGVSDECLRSLSTMPVLRHLDLSGCTAITDTGILALSSLTSLCHVVVYACVALTDSSLLALSQLTQLSHLDVSDCHHMSDGGLVHLASLGRLRHLDVSGCNALTDLGISSLVCLTTLTSLDVSFCPLLTTHGIHSLNSLPRLRELVV
jgi:Leucine-rich repeat (LRR) protein